MITVHLTNETGSYRFAEAGRIRATPDRGSCDRKCHHHGSGPSSFENVPVGPFTSRSARCTGSRAACWTVRVPWKLLRSVAVKPGHAAFTLIPVDSRAEAKATA